MQKSAITNDNDEFLNKIKEKYNSQKIVKFNHFFHLNEKEIFSIHNNYICTYIIQNTSLGNLYFALKHVSSGEGYIFDQENNIYIKSHSQMISKLIIDYKNNYIISCSFDKNINILDLSKIKNNTKNLAILQGHKGRIYDMDLIINKDELLSCGMDKNILLWDIKNFLLIKKICLNSSIQNLMVRYLYINEDSDNNKSKEIIFIYSNNKMINLIDMYNNEIIEKINISNSYGSILLLNNEEFIYQNKKPRVIKKYNFKHKKSTDIFTGSKYEIQFIEKYEKTHKIISYDKGSNIKIWNYIKKFCELTIKIDFVLFCLFVDKNGKIFCGSINKIYIYK